MHQFHPFLLRLSVAVTLWIEIPTTVLLIAPTATIRRIGAVLQILLQLMIILTGNYNFFNLLTIALCLPCMERDDLRQSDQNQSANVPRWLQQRLLTWSFLGWTFLKMFNFSVDWKTWWRSLNVSLAMSKEDCDTLSERLVPVTIMAVMSVMCFKAFSLYRKDRTLLLPFHLLTCLIVTGVIAVPLCSLTPSLQKAGFVGSRQISEPIYQSYARPYQLANGYGLFRRMTGVGIAPAKSSGWAGLPPSVVARPEIILEGVFEGSNTTVEEWHELSFRWKPGNVTEMPRQVAPHQPR
jgi:hypothetical protein